MNTYYIIIDDELDCEIEGDKNVQTYLAHHVMCGMDIDSVVIIKGCLVEFKIEATLL